MTHFLRKPSVLWSSFLIAAIIAKFFPEFGLLLKNPSDIYLSLFEMCVTPLLMTSLIASVAHMLSFNQQNYGILRIFSFFLFIAIALTVFGICIISASQIGAIITDNPAFLDVMISGGSTHPLSLKMADPIKQSKGFIDFFKSLFTDNIFYSLYNSLVLQIILFSILIGAATGCVTQEKKDIFLNFISAIDEIFRKIIGWIMLLLPFGIICIFSSRFLEIKMKYIEIFVYAIGIIITSMILIVLVVNVFISRKIKQGYFDVFNQLRKTMMVSVGTSSVIATMPTYMQTLEKNFKLDPDKIQLYVPITLTTFRFGSIFYFACLSILSVQIFSIPLTFAEYTILILLTILGGFSAVSSGIINIKILSMILQPIGVPSGLMISIFSVLDPLFDPFRMVLNFYLNFCGIVCSIGNINEKT